MLDLAQIGGLIRRVPSCFARYINCNHDQQQITENGHETHKEPHACAQPGCRESIKRPSWMDMNWMWFAPHRAANSISHGHRMSSGCAHGLPAIALPILSATDKN